MIVRTAFTGCAALLWACGAQAATMVQTLSSSYSAGPGVVQRFDPALGTLTGVQFEVGVTVVDAHALSLENIGTDPITVTFSWNGLFNAYLIDGGSGYPAAGDIVAAIGAPIALSETVSLAAGATASSSLVGQGYGTAGSLDLADFIGSSGLYFFAEASGQPGYTAADPTDLFPTEYDNPAPDVYGIGTLTYIYDEAGPTVDTPAVPEPATWLMMLAGFGLVGGALRRGGRALPARG